VIMPTSLPISPAQAAHIAKVSRRTIMRAIETRELKAIRDNRNRWKIDQSDLCRWADAQIAPSGHAHQETPTLPTSKDALELAATKAENGQLRERLAAAETDRDRWQAMAEKLADKPRRRWWPW
jgi:excisionase family DNA binding protein